MRWLAILLLAASGRVAPYVGDPTITADLACEGARAVLESRKAPPPDNRPKPGSRCDNCDGRGYVGDGTIRVKCEPCGGTGRTR